MLKINFLIFIICALFSSSAQSVGIPDSVNKDELIECAVFINLMSKEIREGKTSVSNEDLAAFKDANNFLVTTVRNLKISRDQLASAKNTLLEDFENENNSDERMVLLSNRCAKIIVAYGNEFNRIFGPPLPESFIKSKVILRPYVDDMGGINVKKYIYDLLCTPLSDGGYPKALDWIISDNRYTLKIKFGKSLAVLTFIHDMSEPINGRVSMLMPVQFDGEKIDAIRFSMLMSANRAN